MAKRKLSDTQKEYNKQRRNLINRIKYAEKQGFINAEDLLPSKPKRITQQSINRLKNIGAKEIRKRSKYISPISGKEYKGKKALEIFKEERKAVQEKNEKNKRFERRLKEKLKQDINQREYYQDITQEQRIAPQGDFSVFDRLEQAILFIPEVVGASRSGTWVYFRTDEKYPLLGTLHLAMGMYDIDELASYYLANEHDLMTALSPSRFGSTQEGIEHQLEEAYNLLLGPRPSEVSSEQNREYVNRMIEEVNEQNG